MKETVSFAKQLPVKDSYDVIVCGGGVAGVAAAISAAKRGCSTLLIEKSNILGGLATLGLINLFVPMCNGRGKQIIFGLAEKWLRDSAKYGYDTIPTEWNAGTYTFECTVETKYGTVETSLVLNIAQVAKNVSYTFEINESQTETEWEYDRSPLLGNDPILNISRVGADPEDETVYEYKTYYLSSSKYTSFNQITKNTEKIKYLKDIGIKIALDNKDSLYSVPELLSLYNIDYIKLPYKLFKGITAHSKIAFQNTMRTIEEYKVMPIIYDVDNYLQFKKCKELELYRLQGDYLGREETNRIVNFLKPTSAVWISNE
jgi:hypothetical protein